MSSSSTLDQARSALGRVDPQDAEAILAPLFHTNRVLQWVCAGLLLTVFAVTATLFFGIGQFNKAVDQRNELLEEFVSMLPDLPLDQQKRICALEQVLCVSGPPPQDI